MSEQTVKILIRLLLRSSLIRIYTVCHSFYIFWRHYFIVKLNCFILRTTTIAGLGVPIFRVFTVHHYSLRWDEMELVVVFVAYSNWQKVIRAKKIYKILVSCKIRIARGRLFARAFLFWLMGVYT